MIITTTVQVWLIAAIFAAPVVMAYDFAKLRAVARSRGMCPDSTEWRDSVSLARSSRGVAIFFSVIVAGLLPILPLIVSDILGTRIRKTSASLELFLEAMAVSGSLHGYTVRSGISIDSLIFHLLAMVAVSVLLYWFSAWLMKVILSLRYRAETRALIHPSPAQIRVGAALHASISLLATVYFR